jgi:hypothetical protein
MSDKKSAIRQKMEQVGKHIVKPDNEISLFKHQLHASKIISDAVVEAQKEIQNPPHEQMTLSFMPTSMTRTSPFFPMSRQQMKDRIPEKLTFPTAWGEVSFTGEKLAVYDESILLNLLFLSVKYQSVEIKTTQYEICGLMGTNPCTNTYNAIWRSIDRMVKTNIELKIFSGVGKKRKLSQEMTGNIISFAGTDHKTGKLKIVLNPYFIETYAQGLLTNIDIKFRASLSGDITKSLYRFFQSQRPLYEQGKYSLSLLKLCAAINISNRETHRLRSRIRAGLKELKTKGYFYRYQIDKTDMVTVWQKQKQIKK